MEAKRKQIIYKEEFRRQAVEMVIHSGTPYIIGTAGNERWANGAWSYTAQPESGDPFQLKGYWSSIDTREGNELENSDADLEHNPSTTC